MLPKLNTRKKIAFISSPQLGDSLIAMIVVNNLLTNGYQVTVFGNYLYQLRNWFPNATILKPPQPDKMQEAYSNFDILMCSYPHDVNSYAIPSHQQVIILANLPIYTAKMSLIDVQVIICKDELNLRSVSCENGLIPLETLAHRKYKSRVVIHPTSGAKFRNWSPKKFIKLARLLIKQGFEPCFVVSPNEYQDWWRLIAENLKLFKSDSLDATAKYIYESGWFIGNDSGVGHLASNLGIPTISLILRPSLARQWRPNWAPGIVILPPPWLITRLLKEKFWKNFISVNKVLRIFNKFMFLDKKQKFLQKKSFWHFLICDKEFYNEKTVDFFNNLDFYIQNYAKLFFKKAHRDTTTVAVVPISSQQFVVKRYNVKGFWHALKNCLRKSQALKSWENCHYLIKLGIPTVKPIAIMEKRFGPFRRTTYFISEYIEGIRGCDYFGRNAKPLAEWGQVIENIKTILKKMFAAHIVHSDFQYGNILIADNIPLLLDLEHIRIYHNNRLFRKAFQKDIKHFISFMESNSAARQLANNSLSQFLE